MNLLLVFQNSIQLLHLHKKISKIKVKKIWDVGAIRIEIQESNRHVVKKIL
jgi:hypothetical protein